MRDRRQSELAAEKYKGKGKKLTQNVKDNTLKEGF